MRNGDGAFLKMPRPHFVQTMCYIALDNFLDIMDNERKGTQISRVEHIYKVIGSYPWFEALYQINKAFAVKVKVSR